MTAHSSIKYNWNYPITDELINEIANCVIENYHYNDEERYTPDAYSIFSLVDDFIYNICRHLDDPKYKLYDDTMDYHEIIAIICERVIRAVKERQK